MLYSSLEMPAILADRGEPMTAKEAAYNYQQCGWDPENIRSFSELWSKSSLPRFKVFLKHGLEPFGKTELLLLGFQSNEPDDGKKTLNVLSFPLFPIGYCLFNTQQDDQAEADEWRRLVVEAFSSARQPAGQGKIGCWPLVDLLMDLGSQDLSTDDGDDHKLMLDLLRYILNLSEGLAIPKSLQRSDRYAFCCGSGLVAAILLDMKEAVEVLLESGEDANEPIFDHACGKYRSPLNFALNPPVGPFGPHKAYTWKGIEDRDEGIVELLRDKGAKNFTKELGFTKRLSRSWKGKIQG